MLETSRYLFNWLGFAPFSGVTASVESLSVKVNDVKYSDTKPALGIIFGWDIRPIEIENSILRTNLRWTPTLHLPIEGEKMMLNHAILEYLSRLVKTSNFILMSIIYFPIRLLCYIND